MRKIAKKRESRIRWAEENARRGVDDVAEQARQYAWLYEEAKRQLGKAEAQREALAEALRDLLFATNVAGRSDTPESYEQVAVLLTEAVIKSADALDALEDEGDAVRRYSEEGGEIE